MQRYTRSDWLRLGRTVYSARQKVPALRETQAWADAIGRSSRVLLGLERGEPVGAATLVRIEQALGWPDQWAYNILGDPEGAVRLPAAETVRPQIESEPENNSTGTDDLLFRRPEDVSDDEWQRRRAKLQGYWDALADEVAQER